MKYIARGSDYFTLNGKKTDRKFEDFWAYFASDLADIKIKGSIAEYIIKDALDAEADIPSWYYFDILYKTFRIEVKSSSYIQSYTRQSGKLSSPRFSIGKKPIDFPSLNKSSIPIRNNDFYIFALHNCKDVNEYNPLEISQWTFYIVSTAYINENFDNYSALSLKKVEEIASPCTYENIRQELDKMILSMVGEKQGASETNEESDDE